MFRNLCGSRVRVEMSTGKVRPKPWMRGGSRGGNSGGFRGPRRMNDQNDRCYECGEKGHYAVSCRKRRRDRSRL